MTNINTVETAEYINTIAEITKIFSELYNSERDVHLIGIHPGYRGEAPEALIEGINIIGELIGEKPQYISDCERCINYNGVRFVEYKAK